MTTVLTAEEVEYVLGINQRLMSQITEEDKAKMAEYSKSVQADPNFMEKFKAEELEHYKAADADGDGVLALGEYRVFCAKLREAAEAKGIKSPAMTEEEETRCFQLLCKYNPETGEHFSLEDLHAYKRELATVKKTC